MKRIIGIMVLLLLFIIACQSSDDDDNDTPDEDLHGENGWPEEGLPACPPYQEYQPLFTINNFEQTSWDFRDLYGDHFMPAIVYPDGDTISLQLEEMIVSLDWLDSNSRPVLNEGQDVFVYCGRSTTESGSQPRNLWILDDEGNTLLYHDQVLTYFDDIIDNNALEMEYQFICEYYNNRPPTPDDNNWSLVFSCEIDGLVGEIDFTIDQVGIKTLYNNDEYILFMPVNYAGQLKGEDKLVKVEHMLQIIKKNED